MVIKMAGKKGRSGRLSKLEKDIRQIVIDRSWFQLHKSLLDNSKPDDEKDRIAVSIASKCIPQEIKNSHSGQLKIVQMPVIKVNGKPKIFDVGE